LISVIVAVMNERGVQTTRRRRMLQAETLLLLLLLLTHGTLIK